ncbi:helix-turn-helix transcriptional regulator [Paenibacillus motobuensis]|nr:helix-turn-helix transcriptional regulator [Paenibacillus lutimineralis]MCM3649396.1 helix-turn-helix transcriptional regulator [Paenibacillus motobuensis]
MSQENLAEAIGVSRQAVSKWESGQSYPEMEKMIALSELFQVSIDHLVKGVSVDSSIQGTSAAPLHKSVPEEDPSSSMLIVRKYSYHYEYKSKTTLFGVPLVHINYGRGENHVAKGIIAVGNIAIGVLSLGLIALGGISIGALSAGLISLAALSFGLLLAIGGGALGTIAIGGWAIGIYAIGGLALGMFSLGGAAIASWVAIGGYASGHIAIGDSVRGAYTLIAQDGQLSNIYADEVRSLIYQEYPGLWRTIVESLVWMFR